MKCYSIPTTRAVRPRWLLEERGQTFESLIELQELTQNKILKYV